MEDIKVKINREKREVDPKQIFIGADGENLQGNIIFSFEDEFVQGQARLDIEFRDGNKGQITELKQVGETYVLPIKSEITKYSGCIAQLVIDEGTDENSIPIFKSLYVGLIVAESINATTEVPERYTEWIDSANAKLNQMDNLDLEVSKEDNMSILTITKKDGTQESVEVLDGEKGDKGDKGDEGDKGYTPVKGVDYFTQEDIESLNIPSKTSDITNDSGFITNKVNNLINYYTIEQSDNLLDDKLEQSDLDNYANTRITNLEIDALFR